MASKLDPVDQLNNFQERFDGDIGKAIAAGFGAIIVTVLGGLALIIDAGRRLITDPIGAIIDGVTLFFEVLIGGSADIIGQGVKTTVLSVAPGGAWTIGPLTFALTVGAWGLGLYAFTIIMDMEATSNLIPFTMTDLPFIGSDESEDDRQ
jgi:hypothetical protein